MFPNHPRRPRLTRHLTAQQRNGRRDPIRHGIDPAHGGISRIHHPHPVIIKHPLSGRSALYVNGDFTVKFENWTQKESQPLLDYLYTHACQNEFTCRFHWQQGSMAIWDNRATHHCALNDYHGERRLMHRITIDGAGMQAAAA